MKDIFVQGDFDRFRVSDVTIMNAKTATANLSMGKIASTKTTVFLSHKHDELNDLKGIMGLLQICGAECYIDSADAEMPSQTSGETAKRIKNVIQQCNRFILIATNRAIASKWCNWELGYGDACKYPEAIAVFPIKPGGYSAKFEGNEYLQIYPQVVYRDGSERYKNGHLIKKGYYVRNPYSRVLTPLADWL